MATVYIYITARSLNVHLISNVLDLIVFPCDMYVTLNKIAHLEKMKNTVLNSNVKDSFGAQKTSAVSLI